MPNLNSQQQALPDAILNTNSSINMVARAGTGETYTLVNGAILTIIENKLGSVALTAFNKAAAEEFEQRIERLATETGNHDLHLVDTGTMHSFGFRFWRKVAGKVTVDGWKVANIVQTLKGATRR